MDPVLKNDTITWNSVDVGGEGAYSPAIDIPLDYDPEVQTDSTILAALRVNGAGSKRCA